VSGIAGLVQGKSQHLRVGFMSVITQRYLVPLNR
jgi:hypothetical protein